MIIKNWPHCSNTLVGDHMSNCFVYGIIIHFHFGTFCTVLCRNTIIIGHSDCHSVSLFSFPFGVSVIATVLTSFSFYAVSNVFARAWRTATDVPSVTILLIMWISFTQTFLVGNIVQKAELCFIYLRQTSFLVCFHSMSCIQLSSSC